LRAFQDASIVADLVVAPQLIDHISGICTREAGMSRTATTLLARWIAENVRPVAAPKRAQEAGRLVTEFAAFAADTGLSHEDLEELEEDIGEDLLGYMEDALENMGGSGSPGT
jgi:hypothetical protein